MKNSKYFFLTIAQICLWVLVCSVFSVAQTIDESALPLTDYEMENELWKFRMDEDGNRIGFTQDLIKLIGGDMNLCDSEIDDDKVWENIGPFNSENHYQMNQGRVEAISVNKNNDQDILVGGNNGGAWRTLDGGKTWRNTTDDESFSIVGFHEITRHPKNQKVIYAATSAALNKWNNGQRNYGIGVVMSTDGGESWTLTGHSPPFGGWQSATADIIIDPRSTFDSTILYTINTNKVFRYTGLMEAQGEWEVIFHDETKYNGPAIFGGATNHDLEVDRWGNVFLCNATGVYYLKAGESDFKKLENIIVPEERKNIVMCNGVSRQNPPKALYDLEINRQGHIGLLTNYYYSTPYGENCKIKTRPYYYCTSLDGGRTWTDPVNLKTAGYALPNLAVNQFDINIIYFEGSGRHVRKSINGGKTNVKIKTGRNHVDVRHLNLVKSTYGDTLGLEDVVYVGNDGGIAKLDNGMEWQDITGDGICNTNYFGVGITEADREYIFTGAQDGSLNFYQNGEWYNTSPGGDNGDCLIDPTDKNRVYQSSNGSFRAGQMDGLKWRGRNSKSLVKGVGLFPILMNPNNSDELFAGGYEVYTSLDKGKKWNKIDHVGAPKRINKMAMSKANSDVLYYVSNGYFWNKKVKADEPQNQGGIYKATRMSNGIWRTENISQGLYIKCAGENNCGLPQILSGVTVDPKNEKRIWVAMTGVSKSKKVFYSPDGGSTWENVSACLPNLPMVCIEYQEGSNDGLYLGSEYGVFYKDANMKDWIHYGENSPKVMVTDMHINHASKELVAATLGRGLWRVPLMEN